MRKIIWLFVTVMLVSGCVTVDSINRNAAGINYSDGINAQEAKHIAQKYCLDQGIRDTFTSFPEAEEYFFNPQGRWKVTFQKLNLSQTYVIFIDKKTGEITYVTSE